MGSIFDFFEIFEIIFGLIYLLMFFIVPIVIVTKIKKTQNHKQNNYTYLNSKKQQLRMNNSVFYTKENRTKERDIISIKERYNKIKKENKIYLNGEEYKGE